MKITVTFDSLEEFMQSLRPNEGFAPEGPKKEEEFKPVPAEAVPFEEEKPKEVSLTDVRAIALKLSKSGKQAELKEAFGKFGAKKLSDVAKENYPALMEELGKIDG